MSSLVIKPKETESVEPYYEIILQFVDYHYNFETVNLSYTKKHIDSNFDAFMDFIKLLYVGYYSPPTDKIDPNYKHIKKLCYHNDLWCGECPYYDKKKFHHKVSELFKYDHPYCLETGDDFYRFDCIWIKFYNDKNICHDVQINFGERDIQDIVDRIIDSSSLLAKDGGEIMHKFNPDDPDIFLETSNLARAK